MKKIIVYAMAIASIAAVSCNKFENEAPVTSEGQYSITATIDNSDTKTAYDADGKFSWVAGDQIKVMVYSQSDASKTANFYRFNADEDGTTVSFTCTGTPDWTAYARTGYAVYPSDLALGGTEGAYTVTLPDSYTITGSDFLSALKVPMIGTQVDTDKYSFKTAVGLLKVTLTDIPVEARKLVLKTSDKLAGTFTLDAENGLLMSTGTTTSSSQITLNFPQQVSSGTADFYFPVPVGSISAGATFEIQQEDGTVIKTTPATGKAIPIVRNHIQPLPPIAVENWTSLGTGKFIDNHTFYQADNWSNSTITSDTYLDVEIQQNENDITRYRLVDPYGQMFTTYGATKFSDAKGPYDYLTFTVRPDGYVINDSFRTGIAHYNYTKELWYDNPIWGYTNIYQNNCVIKYDDSGYPANIQLAPFFMGALDEDDSCNPKIEIVFPGSTPMLAGAFNYALKATASYSDGKINVTISDSNITGIKAVVVSNIEGGIVQINNNTEVLSFTTSGTMDYSLSDGTYYIVYKVETAGHGFTYKASDKFEVTSKAEIPLTADMVSVNTDAGTKDGTSHYDGAGPGALVDNDITTYWHTSYYNGYSGYYEFYDLDPTYGAYIDIDLGASKTVTDFEYRACLRSGAGADFPKHVIVYTSADNSTWNKVGESENVCSGTAAGEWITPIQCSGSAARYIRFSIISNTSNKDLRDPSAEGCTHLGEIKIYE